MEHDELVTQGFIDHVDGNETYACRYMQGVLFSDGIVNLSQINGSEGFLETVWSKIKQFIAWLVGLFSKKGDVGKETKEVGAKVLPKAEKADLKVTPVPKGDIDPAKPAPQATKPTEEEKHSDTTTRTPEPLKAAEYTPEKKKAYHDELKAKYGEIKMVTVCHNLNHLYSELKRLTNSLLSALNAIDKAVYETNQMVEHFDHPKKSLLTSAIKLKTMGDYQKAWRDVRLAADKYINDHGNHGNVKPEWVNEIANKDITTICHGGEQAIDTNKITQFDFLGHAPTKERVEGEFKKLMDHFEDEAAKAQVGKIFMRAVKIDWDSESVLGITDQLAGIKKEILDGKYFVRSPDVVI